MSDTLRTGTIATVVAIFLLGVAAIYLHRPGPQREDAPPPRAAEPAPARPAPKAAPRVVTPEPERPRKAAPTPAAAPPAPAVPAAPTTATLMLETDIPGASVFINREYVGTTPLKLDQLEPGEKNLKLTADGYEGMEHKVDLVVGDNNVSLKFREVRLKQRMAVTHKHAMGSCEGTLVATVDGLAYDTTNKGDAFKMTFAQLDTFVVDYLEKNLKVKQKGGKQWNFTDKASTNADKLFVFHRDVEAARKKLADGFTPVR